MSDDPWFRRSFGNGLVPINRKGWLVVALQLLVSAPFFFVIFHDVPGSPPWRLAGAALFAISAAFYFF